MASPGPKRQTTEGFIAKALVVHGDKYDYTKVDYVRSKEEVTITCKDCGNEFKQQPRNHLFGNGCPECKRLASKMTQDEFIAAAKAVHGDRYDYTLLVYVSARENVDVLCKVHGVFSQCASKHLEGCGCTLCGRTNLTTQEFVERAKSLYGDEYDYSEVVYVTSNAKVTFTCSKGHRYEQTPNAHLAGNGCRECWRLIVGKAGTSNSAEFVRKSILVHGNRFDYSGVAYVRDNVPVEISCHKGHKFKQTPNAHLAGKGCKTCAAVAIGDSKRDTRESFIAKAIELYGDEYDYSAVVYESSNKNVKIRCRNGHTFATRPNNHLSGGGCGVCRPGGYSKTSSGNLYILSCGDMTKVGITNKPPNVRAGQISKSFGSDFEVYASWNFEDGAVPATLERSLLNDLRQKYKQPKAKFDGRSECFFGITPSEMQKVVTKHMEQHDNN